MIIAIIIFLAIFVIHILIIPAIILISQTLLYILLAFNYILVTLAAIDYTILLILDPSDPRLKDSNFEESS